MNTLNQGASCMRRIHDLIAGRVVSVLFVGAMLAACGGGTGEFGATPASSVAATETIQPRVLAAAPVPTGAPQERPQPPAATLRRPAAVETLKLSASSDSGMLLLLIPDDLSPADPGVTAWIDAASEVGVRISAVTDAQFLVLGTRGALRFAGLVLPDAIHTEATDQIIAAIRDYTHAGGKTFLTFDFAALTRNADGVPVFPIPKSRLSDLAGVDYVLYDKYLDRTTGLGPVTAMRSTLRELLVPPGKSAPYPGVVSAPDAVVSSAVPARASTIASDNDNAKAVNVPLLDAAGAAPGEALYLAPSINDPGGVHGFDPQQFQMLPAYSIRDRTQRRERGRAPAPQPRETTINFGAAFKAPAPANATRSVPSSSASRVLNATDDSVQSVPGAKASEQRAESGPDQLHAYSGYLLGYLIYPTFQTEGDYGGTTLASSPDFGLVAGISNFGAGKVMFVNMPLTYLKGRTDALPMHGFLNYFVRNVLNSVRLSAMPNAVPGITFNWHLDSGAALTPMLELENAGVFDSVGYSMHLTAGPDTIEIGDGLGFDLDNNPPAQAFLRRMDALGHAVGSHGGWIHDYYGLNANESNAATFLPFLVENRRSVDDVLGHPSRDYSAPQGNNPTWAMTWLENQGVVGAYFAGHTGLGITRQYRDGALLNPKLWVMPVTPFGNYATFEEWQDFNVPKADVMDWFRSMVDFDMAQNTSRLVYAHPPGAYEWMDVTQDFIAYANSKGANKFKWYTIARLADFLAKRDKVQWSQTLLTSGATQVVAAHPVNLAEMVWSVPKDRYLEPTADKGCSVADGGAYWLVKAQASAKTLRFRVQPNPQYTPG